MGEAPKRIQRKRTKGWRMPEGAVYVGRPTRWGNPFALPGREREHRAWAVTAYREWVTKSGVRIDEAAEEHLRGHDLACWCALDQPCHADVLLELANAP